MPKKRVGKTGKNSRDIKPRKFETYDNEVHGKPGCDDLDQVPDEAAPPKAARKQAGQHQRSPKRPVTPPESQTDLREQLVNEGEIGPIEQVSLPEAMITSLLGILLDLDPKWFRKGRLSPQARVDPSLFYKRYIRKMLKRHPVLAKAEVRSSGQGLHGIIRFDAPVVFETDADRQRWAGIVKAIQRVLPTDPDCPGITALTRPVGSLNGKNGGKVQLLHKGVPVPVEGVIALFEEIRQCPFRTVAKILLGSESVTPCPICRKDGTRLDVLDRVGKCYGGCGKVWLSQLYDYFLKPRIAAKEG